MCRLSCRILPNELCKESSLLFHHQPGCENPHQLPQSASESIALTHLCASKMNSTPGQSMTWLCAQHRFLSLESQIPIRGCLVFVSCTLLSGRARCDRCGTLLCTTDCVRQCPSARFCAALPPSPTLFFRGITATVPCRSLKLQKFNNFFLFSERFGRLVTVIQGPGGAPGTRAR